MFPSISKRPAQKKLSNVPKRPLLRQPTLSLCSTRPSDQVSILEDYRSNFKNSKSVEKPPRSSNPKNQEYQPTIPKHAQGVRDSNTLMTAPRGCIESNRSTECRRRASLLDGTGHQKGHTEFAARYSEQSQDTGDDESRIENVRNRLDRLLHQRKDKVVILISSLCKVCGILV